MPTNFKVLTDNWGRVVGYAPKGSEQITYPQSMGAKYAGERITHKGEEYDLDDKGSLIHPSVELPEDVTLKWGVLLGKGVEFVKDDEGQSEVDIYEHVLIPGNTQLHHGIRIGDHAIVRAASIGALSRIGYVVKIGEDTVIGNGVDLSPSVKIGRRAHVGSRTELKRNVKVPDEAHIGSDVFLASNVNLVVPNSYRPGGSSIIIADGVKIEQERYKVTADVYESIPASH